LQTSKRCEHGSSETYKEILILIWIRNGETE
jgi:hypothetical protein